MFLDNLLGGLKEDTLVLMVSICSLSSMTTETGDTKSPRMGLRMMLTSLSIANSFSGSQGSQFLLLGSLKRKIWIHVLLYFLKTPTWAPGRSPGWPPQCWHYPQPCTPGLGLNQQAACCLQVHIWPITGKCLCLTESCKFETIRKLIDHNDNDKYQMMIILSHCIAMDDIRFHKIVIQSFWKLKC